MTFPEACLLLDWGCEWDDESDKGGTVGQATAISFKSDTAGA